VWFSFTALASTRRAGPVALAAGFAVALGLLLDQKQRFSSILEQLGRRRNRLRAVAILLTALVGFPATNRYLERGCANSGFDEPIGGGGPVGSRRPGGADRSGRVRHDLPALRTSRDRQRRRVREGPILVPVVPATTNVRCVAFLAAG
jgi:hypothetical protein